MRHVIFTKSTQELSVDSQQVFTPQAHGSPEKLLKSSQMQQLYKKDTMTKFSKDVQVGSMVFNIPIDSCVASTSKEEYEDILTLKQPEQRQTRSSILEARNKLKKQIIGDQYFHVPGNHN
jgi:hypothetical protein